MNFSKVYNPMMKALLRSPLHGMVSNGIMFITFHGRKSGKVHSTPVNYLREGNNITVFSRRDRVWWRNLRGGAEVTVRVKGRDLKAFRQSFEDDETVASALEAEPSERIRDPQVLVALLCAVLTILLGLTIGPIFGSILRV